MTQSLTFDALYTRYQPVVRRRLQTLLRRYPEEVEDVQQETFIKVWRALAQVQPQSNVRAWIVRIATNTAIDRLRTLQLKTCQSLEQAWASSDGDPLPSDYYELASPVDWYALYDEWDALQARVKELPPRYQRAIALLAAGYSPQEVAHTMHLTPTVCKTVLNRARAMLRQSEQ
jgi:RNA polymerase sigma-70 factor (ECF subfamily)